MKRSITIGQAYRGEPLPVGTYLKPFANFDDDGWAVPRSQPLEFLDDDGVWVSSGVVRARVTENFEGRYRLRPLQPED